MKHKGKHAEELQGSHEQPTCRAPDEESQRKKKKVQIEKEATGAQCKCHLKNFLNKDAKSKVKVNF